MSIFVIAAAATGLAMPNLPVGSETALGEYTSCLISVLPEIRDQSPLPTAVARAKIADKQIASCGVTRTQSIAEVDRLAQGEPVFEERQYRAAIINRYFDGFDCQFRMMLTSLDTESPPEKYLQCYAPKEEENAPD